MFPIADVDYWARRYDHGKDDEDAFAAGKRILAGSLNRSNLKEIVRWKSERRLALIDKNSDLEIEDALRLALAAKEPPSALSVLMGLCGVMLPMASAIMTAIDQNSYTIADWRAMDALGPGRRKRV